VALSVSDAATCGLRALLGCAKGELSGAVGARVERGVRAGVPQIDRNRMVVSMRSESDRVPQVLSGHVMRRSCAQRFAVDAEACWQHARVV
jgi:hypothetical protein